MVERKLDGSYLLTLYREWIKSIRKKNEFLKNISNNYMQMKKKFIHFFQNRVLAKKKTCGTPHGKKNKFLKNIGKGDIKRGSTKGTEKKWSWMVSLYRPWQDLIEKDMGNGMGIGKSFMECEWGCPERTGHGQNSQNRSKTLKIKDFWSRLVQIDF